MNDGDGVGIVDILSDGPVGTGPEGQSFSLFIDIPDKEMKNVCIKFVGPKFGVVLIFWKVK